MHITKSTDPPTKNMRWWVFCFYANFSSIFCNFSIKKTGNRNLFCHPGFGLGKFSPFIFQLSGECLRKSIRA
jgi:hypothetical protein